MTTEQHPTINPQEIKKMFNENFLPIDKEYFTQKLNNPDNEAEYDDESNKIYKSYLLQKQNFIKEDELACFLDEIKSLLVPREICTKSNLAQIVECFNSTKEIIIFLF